MIGILKIRIVGNLCFLVLKGYEINNLVRVLSSLFLWWLPFVLHDLLKIICSLLSNSVTFGWCMPQCSFLVYKYITRMVLLKWVTYLYLLVYSIFSLLMKSENCISTSLFKKLHMCHSIMFLQNGTTLTSWKQRVPEFIFSQCIGIILWWLIVLLLHYIFFTTGGCSCILWPSWYVHFLLDRRGVLCSNMLKCILSVSNTWYNTRPKWSSLYCYLCHCCACSL